MPICHQNKPQKHSTNIKFQTEKLPSGYLSIKSRNLSYQFLAFRCLW